VFPLETTLGLRSTGFGDLCADSRNGSEVFNFEQTRFLASDILLQ
jgi:hypothetical protein